MYTKLNETIPAMNSDDFKERFKAEYWQLKIRVDNLEKMLARYKDGTLNFTPKCSYDILREQAIFMREYQRVLGVRALIEGIELDDTSQYSFGYCCCKANETKN